MSDGEDKNLGGRPRLSEDEASVRIAIVVPESLRDRLKEELGRGDMSIAVRGFLKGYLDLNKDQRKDLNSEEKIRRLIVDACSSKE